MKFTLKQIKEYGPCQSGWKYGMTLCDGDVNKELKVSSIYNPGVTSSFDYLMWFIEQFNDRVRFEMTCDLVYIVVKRSGENNVIQDLEKLKEIREYVICKLTKDKCDLDYPSLIDYPSLPRKKERYITRVFNWLLSYDSDFDNELFEDVLFKLLLKFPSKNQQIMEWVVLLLDVY